MQYGTKYHNSMSQSHIYRTLPKKPIRSNNKKNLQSNGGNGETKVSENYNGEVQKMKGYSESFIHKISLKTRLLYPNIDKISYAT